VDHDEGRGYRFGNGGGLKKRLGIALPDCFVIASAKRIGGRALFKSVKKEMRV